MITSPLVAGIDSSTQSCKLVLVDGVTGDVVASKSVPHPDGTSLSPDSWWGALEKVGAAELGDVAAASIAAQQHTTIFLDDSGRSVRDALLWNDQRAAQSALDLRAEVGSHRWADEVGAVPTAAHPVAKLRWLATHEPENARRVARVLVPHDWLTWRLLDYPAETTTDRSDASGTGYWSPVAGSYKFELMAHALGRTVETPRVLSPSDRAGMTAHGVVLGAGCGDNAAALLGLDARIGEAVVSVGTSLTISMSSNVVASDPTGHVAAMADARGMQLPMVATLNGARTLESVASLLGVTVPALDELSAAASADAGGVTLLPYLDGERTPFLPDARGAILGLTRASMRPENLARAAVLSLACVIAESLDDLLAAGVEARSVTIVGGGARSAALRQAVADVTGQVVRWPEQREYAAIGAARQAMWALTGELPTWTRPRHVEVHPSADRAWVAPVRDRYREASRGM